MAAPTQNINQFKQSPVLGQLDLQMNTTTVSCQVDATEAGHLVAGQSVKLVDSAGGVPKIVACDDNADVIFGFINYDIKSQSFVAGDMVEVSSMYGNVMYLNATAAIARGALLKGVVATIGGVAVTTPGGLENIIGWAYDKATAADQLIRVVVNCPSFFKS